MSTRAEMLASLTCVIEYRKRKEGGPWRSMIGYDVRTMADEQAAKLNANIGEHWPWEYRVSDLPVENDDG